MSVRVGIGVANGVVRAVAVRDGSVLWAAESSVDGRTIEAAVAELFGAAAAPLVTPDDHSRRRTGAGTVASALRPPANH